MKLYGFYNKFRGHNIHPIPWEPKYENLYEKWIDVRSGNLA